jgi:hypothetical protein
MKSKILKNLNLILWMIFVVVFIGIMYTAYHEQEDKQENGRRSQYQSLGEVGRECGLHFSVKNRKIWGRMYFVLDII